MTDQKPTIAERYPGQGLFSRCLYRCAQSITYRLARLLYGYKPQGLEHIPPSGPVVVVCNHQSHFDPPLVSHCFRKRAIHFFARDTLFDIPLLGALIPRLQAFPVKRGEADTKAIRDALDRLEMGAAVLLFPEGTRSKTGEVQEFKRGALLLLRKAKCPVLPVAIDGAIDAFPRTKKFPKLFGPKLSAKVGAPIAYDDLFKNGPDAALERLRDEVVRLKEASRRG